METTGRAITHEDVINSQKETIDALRRQCCACKDIVSAQERTIAALENVIEHQHAAIAAQAETIAALRRLEDKLRDMVRTMHGMATTYHGVLAHAGVTTMAAPSEPKWN